MRYGMTAAVIALVAFNGSMAAEPIDLLAAKKVKWQKQLEETKFQIAEDQTSVMYSLSQYIQGNYKIHVIYEPNLYRNMTFKFERAGKETLAVSGHARSVFRIDGDVLYFAHFPTSGSGCTVTSYDLAAGTKLWETRLDAVGCPPHSVYQNAVTLDWSNLPGLDKEGEGSIRITGRESVGDYIEILDRTSGKVLAHKIYRDGFAPPK